jgi:hypothetical protein
MRQFTIKEWEERFDELFTMVEEGEVIGIYDEITGHRAVFVPYDHYKELND